MALIKCPECGKEISDKASACIHCGFPLNNIDQDHTLYNAILETTGPNRAKLNVALRNIRTLSLVEAKNMIDSAPCVIKEKYFIIRSATDTERFCRYHGWS